MSPSNKIPNSNNNRTRRAKKLAMARRGHPSLAPHAVAAPSLLTIINIYYFQVSLGYVRQIISVPTHLDGPHGLPLHLLLMGLSVWLIWAEGGFRGSVTTLQLYVSQSFLGLSWGPIVFAHGAMRLGLAVSGVLVVALYGCSLGFGQGNPIAGNLVKPSIAWATFLFIMNYNLL